MNRRYDHLSIEQCELEAKCCQCERLNILRIGDPFEVHHMVERFYNGMINDGWYDDHGGHWHCPECKGVL